MAKMNSGDVNHRVENVNDCVRTTGMSFVVVVHLNESNDDPHTRHRIKPEVPCKLTCEHACVCEAGYLRSDGLNSDCVYPADCSRGLEEEKANRLS